MKKDMLLPLNLQFFGGEPGGEPSNLEPSEPTEPSNPTEPKNLEPTPATQEPNEPKKDQIMIPKTRFDQVKQELDQLKTAQQQALIDEQKKQGEFEKLYGQASKELETYKKDFNSTKERAEHLEGIMTSMLNTKMETIPEEFHDLIPENLSPEQKLDWISKADAKGLFKDKSQEPLGGQTNPGAQKADLDNMPVNLMFQSGYKK